MASLRRLVDDFRGREEPLWREKKAENERHTQALGRGHPWRIIGEFFFFFYPMLTMMHVRMFVLVFTAMSG